MPAEPHSFPLSPSDGEREIPHSYEAEQALLGAIFCNNKAYDAVADFLAAEHFADGLHGRIFDICRRLIDRDELVTPVTIKRYLESDAEFRTAGGKEYLAALAGAAATVINAHDFGRLIYETHQRRELIWMAEQLREQAYNSDLDLPASKIIEDHETQLYGLANGFDALRRIVPLQDAMNTAYAEAKEAMESDNKIIGVRTGIHDLDYKIGGARGGELIIIAGRPGMGKTSLVTNIGVSASRQFVEEADPQPKQVAFFSLEMPAGHLATRVMAAHAGVSSEAAILGRLNYQELNRLDTARRELAELPFWIDETPAQKVSAMRARARRLANRRGGLGAIIVDYIGLARPDDQNKNRVHQIEQVTGDLKSLAKELDVPVYALAQLNRGVELRDDKRPQLADLRDSGAIEQDADIVMLLYREAYYLEKNPPVRGSKETQGNFNDRMAEWELLLSSCINTGEVIFGKNRRGSEGTVRVGFNPQLTLFSDLKREDQDQGSMDFSLLDETPFDERTQPHHGG